MNLKKILFFLTVIALFSFFLTGYFLAGHKQNDRKETLLGTAESCDPRKKTCAVEDKGIGIAFSLSSRVEYLQPFQIKVVAAGISASEIEKVIVMFEMSDMDMGQNRFVLKSNQDGIYSGMAVLPVCVSGRADWNTRVKVITRSDIYQGIFNFRVSG